MMKRHITLAAHITSGNSLLKRPHVQHAALADFIATRFLKKNVIAIQLVKKTPASNEPGGSLPYSQKPAIGPYPETVPSFPHIHTLLL
jgi:hypothetical protein